ncbi:MAG TPA: hypothetical protein VMV49_11440 [Candidatus Deferrimicrobium sp.]|nr:hypothetical protein [Candidatus Deferrimicrobium sp.]
MEADLEKIVISIGNKMGAIVGARVYAAIVSPNGKALISQDGIIPFLNIIETFVKSNFHYLQFGDHSIPMSGSNLVFFRTKNAIIALYTPKGRHGQLLSFKSQFNQYSSEVDGIVGESSLDSAVVPFEIVKKIPLELVYERDTWKIKPVFSVNLSGKEKLPMEEAVILNQCNGNNSISKISKEIQRNNTDIIKILIKYDEKGWIKFPDNHLISLTCPNCKIKNYIFIPKVLFDKCPSDYIRIQIAERGCIHTYTVFIDKKLKIAIQPIEYFIKCEDTVDFSKLSLENLLRFFGQDLFCNIFHALLLNSGVLIIDEISSLKEIGERIAEFLKKIFPNVEYETNIRTLSTAEYYKDWKKCKDFLIIDLATNFVLNEPYPQEKFYKIAEILKEALKEKDEQKQVLKLNQEFERLVLLTEPVMNIAEKEEKVIVETDLIKKVRENYNLELRLEEIALLKKLIKAYYNVDTSKKIVSELSYSIW